MTTAGQSTPKRRLFTRIHFEAEVVLNTFPGEHPCSLVDISLRGALVERPQAWTTPVGAPCSLSVKLAGGGASIHMVGEVAHVEAGRLGLRCTEIDIDSMTALRRLVELNLGDETALHREIHAMVLPGTPG